MGVLLRYEPVPEPAGEYELRDQKNRPIGRVVEPCGVPRAGPGAETVLLVRAPARAGHARVSLPPRRDHR